MPTQFGKQIPWFSLDSFSKTGCLLTIYWPCSKDCKVWHITKLRWFSKKKVDIFIIYNIISMIFFILWNRLKIPLYFPVCTIPWLFPDFTHLFPIPWFSLQKFPVFPVNNGHPVLVTNTQTFLTNPNLPCSNLNPSFLLYLTSFHPLVKLVCNLAFGSPPFWWM